MNFNNFTIKSQEAVQEAVNLVQSRGQQAIEPVHIMQGVMKVGENVTNFIFQKLGMNGQQVALVVDKQIDSLPKVSSGMNFSTASYQPVCTDKSMPSTRYYHNIIVLICTKKGVLFRFNFKLK